jgi:NADH-quinone oxidoreductase subunit C
MTPADAIRLLQDTFGDAVRDPVEFRGEHSITVERARIVEACRLLKSKGFIMLVDLSGVDHYGDEPRFEVAYHLRSMKPFAEVRLKVFLSGREPEVDTVTTVWQTADWHEREAWDMLGIRFRGHPNLKRILMWEGYPYHPLRKDFPVAGLPCDLPATAVDAGGAEAAPMAGGPFVPGTGTRTTLAREPRQYDTAAEQAVKQASPVKDEPV